MLIIAHLNINDPAGFWAAAEQATPHIPAHLTLHGVFPSKDGKMGTCLWEAGQVQEVQQFLDENMKQYAQNTCYEVNAEKSMGLTKLDLAAAQMT